MSNNEYRVFAGDEVAKAKLKVLEKGLDLAVQEAKRTRELVQQDGVNPRDALLLLIDYIIETGDNVRITNSVINRLDGVGIIKEKNPKS